MKDTIFKISSTRILTKDVYELNLEGDTSDITICGQFVEISVPGLYLRRPISVCDWGGGTLKLLIREVGVGTAFLRTAAAGTELKVITGLGNGFDFDTDLKKALIVGGGIGIAPLFALAKAFTARGVKPYVVLGFRNNDDAFYVDEFKDEAGAEVFVATEDGSLGTKGFVTDAIRENCADFDYCYSCGPMPMLCALSKMEQFKDGQFSLEARMGCGFGACVGCTIKSTHGPVRVCLEGPIFRKGEIVW